MRSFGIIGGGAVLFAASALSGALAPIAGEKRMKSCFGALQNFSRVCYSWWRISSSRSRYSSSVCSSLLCCSFWPVLRDSARAQTWQIQMSKILLEGQLWTHLPFFVSQRSNCHSNLCVYAVKISLWISLYLDFAYKMNLSPLLQPVLKMLKSYNLKLRVMW